jgi:haloalkane dehalogenase
MKKLLMMLTILLFWQGCTATKTKVVDRDKPKFIPNKVLYPYESNYLVLKSGAKIHYLDEGEGDVLLLLHGNPTWSFLYRKMVAELSQEFRVIVPDYAGFGLSYAPKDFGFTAQEHAAVMKSFVKELGLKDMTIMVQDWGGPIGFDIALNQPDNVKAFVIGNTWAWPLERTGHKAFSVLMGGYIGQFISWSHNGIVDFFMSQGVEKALSDEVLAMYHAPFKEQESRKATHIFPAQLWDADAFLTNVHKDLPSLSKKPALIVWGLEDFAFQEPERQRFESIFTNHQTVLLENTGHFLQEDAPDKIVNAIKKWYPTIKNE